VIWNILGEVFPHGKQCANSNFSWCLCIGNYWNILRCLADKRNDKGAGCCFDGSSGGELQAQLQAVTTTERTHRAALWEVTKALNIL
jgi:hypothetical protein